MSSALHEARTTDALHRVVSELCRKYGDRAAPEEIEREVFSEADRFKTARVHHFIPVLVQHAVQEKLRRRLPDGSQRAAE